MHDKEALDMMIRCKEEILSLHRQIDGLAPKAAAYDDISKVLSLLPGKSIGMSEDLAWRLDKRIRELQENAAKPEPKEGE